jgi:hypothetical protein
MRYSREHFTNGTPPRLMGSESEINVVGINKDDGTSAFKKAANGIDYVSRGRFDGHSIVLPNGGEIYLDIGRVVEITTPECPTAREVVLHELVGERVVRQMADNIAPNGKGQAYKRSGYAPITQPEGQEDHEALSVGHHENYFYIQPEGSGDRQNAIDQMKSYLYTRQVWAGTGFVTPKGYAISQKIGAVNFGSKSVREVTSHGKKPAIKIQDLRMEVRTGEGNISEWAILQKFALTSLVLRLIEHKQFPAHLIVKKYEEGDDQLPLYTPFSEINTRGGLVRSTSHQRTIARTALDYFCNMPDVPQEELEAAAAVIKTCNDIDAISSMSNDVSSIADRVEWASKLSYLRRKHEDESLTTNDRIVVAKDLNWDNISGTGTGKHWYRLYGQTTDADTLDEAAVTPPGSRATARIAGLRHLRKEGIRIEGVDWKRVRYDAGDGTTTSYEYEDPYEEKAA